MSDLGWTRSAAARTWPTSARATISSKLARKSARRGPSLVTPFSRMMLDGRGLEPAEAEIEAVVLRPGHGEGEGAGIAVLPELLDDRSAGIAETQELGDLVQRLPGRVVAGPAEELVGERFVHQVEGRVAARDEETQHGKGDARILEEAGLEVGLEVVDAEERLLVVIRQTLGKGQPDEERADEPGPLGHGVEIDGLEADARPPQRFADDGRDRLDVLPRRQLGYDAAVRRVNLVLGQDDIAEYLGRRVGTRTGGSVPGSGARRTAAEVSSQEVSMARTSTSGRPFPIILSENTGYLSGEEKGRVPRSSGLPK